MLRAMARSPGSDRRALVAWTLYDFANSSFTTLIVTFVYATYFTSGIVGDQTLGTALWSRGVIVTAAAVALLSPFVGALADRGGYRKVLMLAATVVCVGATASLFFPTAGQIGLALGLFVIANVAYEMGVVLYNAFLPDIARADRIGRVSGFGWALGYLGGLSCLVLALVGFVQPDAPWFGLSREGCREHPGHEPAGGRLVRRLQHSCVPVAERRQEPGLAEGHPAAPHHRQINCGPLFARSASTSRSCAC